MRVAPDGVGLGFDVAATDIDGDGFGDLIIGAPFSDPGQAGAAYPGPRA
ncbi:MAG TPA: FG-GAP repeat protein [Caulobacter sp.]|nr:FG-GAP repeat protein [Caulobacter sp.]